MSMFPLSFDVMDVNVSSNKSLASMDNLEERVYSYPEEDEEGSLN